MRFASWSLRYSLLQKPERETPTAHRPKIQCLCQRKTVIHRTLFMISVNNQRQHVGGEEGKQKYGARGMSPRTRLCNQRAERH